MRGALTLAISRCPYCGSTDIVYDEKHGAIVCRDCGSVLAESMPENLLSPTMVWHSQGLVTNTMHITSRKNRVRSHHSMRLVNIIKHEESRRNVKRLLGIVLDDDELSDVEYEALGRLLENYCVVKKLLLERRPEIRKVLLQMLIEYLVTESMPFSSPYARDVNVNSLVLMKKFKRIVRSCLTNLASFYTPL
ncbi:MAG: TFIIB-type zinc ribbon-containing protein [Pyrodictiaceae archaeon]